MRASDTCFLDHTLWTDDDARQAEIDVRERSQQPLIELSCARVTFESAVKLW